MSYQFLSRSFLTSALLSASLLMPTMSANAMPKTPEDHDPRTTGQRPVGDFRVGVAPQQISQYLIYQATTMLYRFYGLAEIAGKSLDDMILHMYCLGNAHRSGSTQIPPFIREERFDYDMHSLCIELCKLHQSTLTRIETLHLELRENAPMYKKNLEKIMRPDELSYVDSDSEEASQTERQDRIVAAGMLYRLWGLAERKWEGTVDNMLDRVLSIVRESQSDPQKYQDLEKRQKGSSMMNEFYRDAPLFDPRLVDILRGIHLQLIQDPSSYKSKLEQSLARYKLLVDERSVKDQEGCSRVAARAPGRGRHEFSRAPSAERSMVHISLASLRPKLPSGSSEHMSPDQSKTPGEKYWQVIEGPNDTITIELPGKIVCTGTSSRMVALSSMSEEVEVRVSMNKLFDPGIWQIVESFAQGTIVNIKFVNPWGVKKKIYVLED